MEIEEWHPPGQAEMPSGPDSFPQRGVNSLASLEGRGTARLFDLVLVFIPYFVVFGLVTILVSGTETSSGSEAEQSPAAYLTLIGPYIGLLIVYETVCVTLWGQTLGKLIFGIRVARQVNGRCPLWWEAALRIGVFGVVAVIPHPIAWVVAPTLYLAAGFDPLRRNVLDRAAGTVVVRTR